MAKVAFLGLGVMGFPMAGHLVKKGGHEVTVYNRTEAKAKQWVEKFGGSSAPTPKAAAEGQDFVMCCVGNDNDLRAVTLGADSVRRHEEGRCLRRSHHGLSRGSTRA
jgi:3-hydroxyisobutyrate dehydrogenase